MIDDPVVIFAVVGALGVGSQWLAWRLQLPAIVLMLAAGLLAGPASGLLNPEAQLGDLFRPVIAVAVAVILFEGGISLNFKEIRETRPAIRRLVYLGAPLGWLASTLACHFVAGLDWASSAVFGGILVVTGPTVVTPLLRQAKLSPRPSSVLRWEAIVNDPIGALFAVIAFELAIVFAGANAVEEAATHLVIGVIVAGAVGYAAGRILARAFRRGWAPEYMKAPILLASVLAVYAVADMALHESGLLAVTVMGAVMGNARLPSLTELVRFKEQMTVVLVSGVFILLAATVDKEMMTLLDWRAAAFIAVAVLVARPAAVLTALIGTDLPPKERAMVAWVAPRGVVAVAVAGFFGARLQDLGFEDGQMLAPLAFALVTATVILHGFTIRPVARLLGLTSTEPPGVVIVGGSPFSKALAGAIAEGGAPVLIADRNWWRLRDARRDGATVYHGEILSDAFEHKIDVNRFGHLIAATDNDAYNALVCTNFGPEFGRDNVRQIARREDDDDHGAMPVTLGGRGFAEGEEYGELNRRVADGWRVTRTRLSEKYSIEDYREARPDIVIIAAEGKDGELVFFSPHKDAEAAEGEVMIALAPPDEAKEADDAFGGEEDAKAAEADRAANGDDDRDDVELDEDEEGEVIGDDEEAGEKTDAEKDEEATRSGKQA